MSRSHHLTAAVQGQLGVRTEGHCQKKGLGAGKGSAEGLQSSSALTLPRVPMLGG